METLKYIIENNIVIADNIVKEYPNVDCVIFKIPNCSYYELKEIAFENKREIELRNGEGKLSLLKGKAFCEFTTKPLIVSEPVIIEE